MRTITKRNAQCVQCGDWLEDWEVHPECDVWTFCIPCGEQFFHSERWLPVILVDFIVHDEAHPFCEDVTCPCHQQNDLAWSTCWQPYYDGLLTAREAARFFYGEQF